MLDCSNHKVPPPPCCSARLAVRYLVLTALVNLLGINAVSADKQGSEFQPIRLRFVGGDEQIPLAGLKVEITSGHGSDRKIYGTHETANDGTALVSLPVGFYSLHLTSPREISYLPVEVLWKKRERELRPDLSLAITEAGPEKWLSGKRRDEGHEAPLKPHEVPRITYTLLHGCELVLRAVDAETGKGLPGARFYTENALGEEWAHPIEGQNLGAKPAEGSKQAVQEASSTDRAGNFRRLVGANANFKYGVAVAPTGYEDAEPGLEVDIPITYGMRRAEHVFKFRRIR